MYPIANASSFDALVVGRGAVGAATALGLARAGLRVGMVAPGAPEPAPLATVMLRRVAASCCCTGKRLGVFRAPFSERA